MGSWPCHTGSTGGVPAKGVSLQKGCSQHGSIPASPALPCPGFGVVPRARAVGRTEIQLVLLMGGVTGPAGVGPSAAALGNFCFRTKPLCWLGELEPRQGGSLKDFCP